MAGVWVERYALANSMKLVGSPSQDKKEEIKFAPEPKIKAGNFCRSLLREVDTEKKLDVECRVSSGMLDDRSISLFFEICQSSLAQ